MLLNSGPINAAPLNSPGNNAGTQAGALAQLLVASEGLGNALELVFAGAGQSISVESTGFAKPTIGSTASIQAISLGNGVAFVLSGLSRIDVDVQAAGTVDGFSLSETEIAGLAQSGYVLGNQSAIDVDATAFGRVVDASQSAIDALAQAGFVVQGANQAPITIEPTASGEVIDGNAVGIELETSAFGRPTQGAFVLVDIDALGDALVSHLGLTEAGVEALAQAKGQPIDGATRLIEAVFAGVGQVIDGQTPDITIESFMDFVVSQAVDATPSILIDPHANGFVSGGAQELVQAIAQAKGQVQAGQAALVDVDPITGGSRVLPIGESLAALEALAEGKGSVVDGALVLVELESRAIGFILSKLQAPLFRIIEVQPKDKTIIVPPKRKSIVFSGDDRSLQMVAEFEKQPREIVDYDIDMREWFQAAGPEDFIRRIESLTIEPDGELVHGGPGVPFTVLIGGDQPQQAKVWLSGGVDGREYKVTALISTNIGRQEEIDFLVRIEDV